MGPLQQGPLTVAAPAPAASVIGVREVGTSLADDLRAVRMIWKRELIRFGRNRMRMFTSLAQPILFLFVLGTGLSPIIPGGAKGRDPGPILPSNTVSEAW